MLVFQKILRKYLSDDPYLECIYSVSFAFLLTSPFRRYLQNECTVMLTAFQGCKTVELFAKNMLKTKF